MMHRANVFGLVITNGVYSKDDDEFPVDQRFVFNAVEDVAECEKNFFLNVLCLENRFQHALKAMKKYITLTEKAKDNIRQVILM